MNIQVNKYQTEITDELLNSLPQEASDQLLDFINNVPFIRTLIDPKRGYAKDRPRDSKGRIIVDLVNPHILEDMDYFRPTALYYKKHGVLTHLKPNANINSEFGKWIRQERDRCWVGMVRESDGEWITGLMYFYLNYSPIMLAEMIEGTKRANRIQDFPHMWEGVYWRFHYKDQAKNGGLYNNWEGGQHCAELASRGKSKSYCLASILAHNIVIGENEIAFKNTMSIITASSKEYLSGKDGTLSKFIPMMDFCAEFTQFPRKRLRDSMQDMIWRMGYKDAELGIEKGTLNSVVGVSSNDDESKLRGKRACDILIEEMGTFPRLLDLYNVLLPSVQEGDIAFGQIYMLGCVCKGTKVWAIDGRNIPIEALLKEDGIIGYSDGINFTDNLKNLTNGITKEPIGKLIDVSKKECVEIVLTNGNILRCSKDHPIYTQTISHPRKVSYKIANKRNTVFKEQFKPADQLGVGDRICECRTINIFGKDILFDPRLIGMLIGDGSYGFDQTPKYSSEDIELQQYIQKSYEYTVFKTNVTKKGKIYQEMRIRKICPLLRNIGIYGQTKTKKRLPNNYQTLDRNNVIDLLSGLYDTDGTVYSCGQKSYVGITQSNDDILKQIQILWRKFGVIGSITKTSPNIKLGRKDKNSWYTLVIGGRNNLIKVSNVLNLLVSHKTKNLNLIKEWFELNKSKKECGYSDDLLVYKIKSIKNVGLQDIYNLSACLSHTYLANNIITHNTAGDDESDFAGAQEIMYNPRGYNMYALPNVFDKFNQGRKDFVFFFPGYINRKGCMNKDGVSDIIAALIQILKNRFKVKYNSSDPNTIIKTIAEIPITPAEAIVKVGVNMFPMADLTERLAQIDMNPREYDDVFVGDLVLSKSGEVEFKITNDIPIREFPHKDNKIHGALEIYKMPEKDKTGKIFANRYILSADPYDDDSSDTLSLGSIFVLDLWTDNYVAEYTGRPQYADDFYEMARRLCLFFNGRMNYENNKKGLFAYFSRMNSLYLLTDILDFLKDKDMIKGSAFGNKAKGTVATAPINAYGRTLLRNWLLKPTTRVELIDREEQEVTVPNLFNIRNRALIKELIGFNSEGNFDRVSANIMLMLLREDKMIMYNGNLLSSRSDESESSYLGNDDFFKVNYDYKFKDVFNKK